MRNIIKIIIVYFTIFFFLEITARTLLSLVTNLNAFKFGFDKSLKIYLLDASDLKFEISRFDVFSNEKNNLLNTESVWAFGGSTTEGYNCPEGQSSWVYFLNNIYNNTTFTNYGRKSDETDDSIVSLIQLLQNQKIPNVILWAHRYNEDQVIHHGPKRNKELIGKYKNISIHKNNNNQIIFFFRRIEKTFYSYSAFYFLFNEFSLALLQKYGYFNNYAIAYEPTIDEYNMALENYRLNTQQAIDLADTYKIDFYIILLPRPEDFDALSFGEKKLSKKGLQMRLKYENDFFEQAKKLSKDNNIYLINVVDEYFNKTRGLQQFCDGAHWSSEGHKLIADIISDNINKLKK